MRHIHKARARWQSLLCGASVTVALAACSTVRSVDISQTPIKARQGAYFTYSVPKTLLTIQLAAAGSASPASAGAGSAAAAGSTPTSWTLSGTIVSGSGEGAGSGASKAPSADTSRCGVLTAEYAAAQTQVAARMADFTKLLAQTVRLAAPQPGAKPAESKDIQDYVKKTQDYMKAVKGAPYQDLVAANLPQAVSKSITPGIYDLITTQCPTRVSVTVQTSIIPDVSRNFALLHNTNIFYADSLTFGVDANNFLTNGAPSSTSQVGAIASAIASDIGLASAPSPGRLAAGVLRPQDYGVVVGALGARLRTGPTCRYDPAAELDAQLLALNTCDPSTHEPDAAAVTAIAEAVFVKLESSYDPGSLQNLPSTALPLTLYASLDDWAPDGSLLGATGYAAKGDGGLDPPSAHRVLLSQALEAFRVSLDLHCAPRSEGEQSPKPASDKSMGGKAPKPAWDEPLADRSATPENAPSAKIYDGLVVSATRPCRLEASQARSGFPGAPDGKLTVLPIAETAFTAQDSRYLTILPTQRGFLVARSVGYTFSGGLPTGVTDSRPSEALAFVAFPGQVVGAFFSGLSSAYSNRQTGVKGHTDEINAEANLYTAQAALVAAQQKANAAEHPAGGSGN